MRFITHNHGGAHDIVFLHKRKGTNKLWLHDFHQIIKSYVDIPFITSSYGCVWVSQHTTESSTMTHMYLRLKDGRYYHLRNTCDFIHEVNLSAGLFNTHILKRYPWTLATISHFNVFCLLDITDFSWQSFFNTYPKSVTDCEYINIREWC